MLFKELILKPTNKEVSKRMGNTFDSKMPEKHYIDKISDLEYRLHIIESILKRVVDVDPDFNSMKNGISKIAKYFEKHEEVK